MYPRLLSASAVLLALFFASITPASAGPGKGPKRGRNLPDLKVAGISEQGQFARIVLRNQGRGRAGLQVVGLRVFRGGRQIGSFRGVVGGIPGGGSRAVLIRTGLRLNQPGTVLAVRADATNAVFESNERNNRLVRVNRPLAAVLKGAKGGGEKQKAEAEAEVQQAEEKAEAGKEKEKAGEGEGE